MGLLLKLVSRLFIALLDSIAGLVTKNANASDKSIDKSGDGVPTTFTPKYNGVNPGRG